MSWSANYYSASTILCFQAADSSNSYALTVYLSGAVLTVANEFTISLVGDFVTLTGSTVGYPVNLFDNYNSNPSLVPISSSSEVKNITMQTQYFSASGNNGSGYEIQFAYSFSKNYFPGNLWTSQTACSKNPEVGIFRQFWADELPTYEGKRSSGALCDQTQQHCAKKKQAAGYMGSLGQASQISRDAHYSKRWSAWNCVGPTYTVSSSGSVTCSATAGLYEAGGVCPQSPLPQAGFAGLGTSSFGFSTNPFTGTFTADE